MKKIFLGIIPSFMLLAAVAQKQVQELPPARLGIFKNGTCFVKREALVNVTEKNFYIKAPDKVLMGTYWVAVGKESSLHSVVVKTDTFKVTHAAKYLVEYLQANIGQNITLYGNAENTELRKLSGKLLAYDLSSEMMKVAAANGKTIVTSSNSFDWFETAGDPKSTISVDSIIAIAKVNITKPAEKIMASTISLEKGVQWFPSYLFTITNDKEAKLELKATIANGGTEYLRMPVDIIIGSPEMFYGKSLDPVCIDYLSQSLLEGRYDNNLFANGLQQTYNFSTAATVFGATSGETRTYEWEEEGEEKKIGQKAEDLYYYQLGVLDLEKNSRVIVPVMSTAVTYTEIYTADLPLISTSLEDENSIQTYHSYLITNTTNAPFTTGTALVLDRTGQPLAQAQLTYTPVKGTAEMQLSKAVDVQVKNEEEETSREKSNVIKSGNIYYERVITGGTITINNYKDKKIKIRVTKSIDGVFSSADNAGKARKIKSTEYGKAGTEIYWEVEVEAGAKLVLKYEYYMLK